MTRRSITTVLGSLLIGLLIIVNAPAVAAADVSGGGSTANATRECTRPTFGFPTCFTLQADGLWAREELTLDETGANWVVVGTATLAEVIAAVGDVYAVAS